MNAWLAFAVGLVVGALVGYAASYLVLLLTAARNWH